MFKIEHSGNYPPILPKPHSSGGPGVPFSAGLQSPAISSQTDLSGRDHYRDGRLDLANVAWDKVAGRQTLNCFEARPPLAKEEMPARPSSALTPASPQRRLLESWSSAPPTRSTCVWIFTLEVLLDDNVTVR